jgi:hypothetical protein
MPESQKRDQLPASMSWSDIEGIRGDELPDEALLPVGTYLFRILKADANEGPQRQAQLDVRMFAVQPFQDVDTATLTRLFPDPSARTFMVKYFLSTQRELKWFLTVFCSKVLQMGPVESLVMGPQLIDQLPGKEFIARNEHVGRPKDSPNPTFYNTLNRGSYAAASAVGGGNGAGATAAQAAAPTGAPPWPAGAGAAGVDAPAPAGGPPAGGSAPPSWLKPGG